MKTLALIIALTFISAPAFAGGGGEPEPTSQPTTTETETDLPTIHVDAPVDVEVRVEPTPVTIESNITVEPTPVTVDLSSFQPVTNVAAPEVTIDAPTPWYEKWYVWTGTGAVVISAVVLGVVLSRDDGGHTTNVRSGFAF